MVSIPKEAYSYWPDERNTLIETKEYVERLIFGRQNFKAWEASSLAALDKQVAAECNLDCVERLRFLYGAGWSIPEAVSLIQGYVKWRAEWPSYKLVCQVLQDVLKSGGIYFHGRDHRYRPVIYISPYILSFFPLNLLTATIYYFLEFSKETLFIPGQIENLILVLDLTNFTPTDELNQILNTLLTKYPCRLARAYIYNHNKSIQPFLKLLSLNTLNKLVINGKDSILDICNPGQVEQKFGGSAENLANFWPPVFPNGPFRAPNDPPGGFLSSHSSYGEYFMSGFKNSSILSSLKISAMENDSFFSNSELKNEFWQNLEVVDASFSFLNTDACTKMNEVDPELFLSPGKVRSKPGDSTRTSSNVLKKLTIETLAIETNCCIDKVCQLL